LATQSGVCAPISSVVRMVARFNILIVVFRAEHFARRSPPRTRSKHHPIEIGALARPFALFTCTLDVECGAVWLDRH